MAAATAAAALMLLVGAYVAAPLPPAQLPEATRVYDAHGRLVAHVGVQRRVSVPLREVPRHVQLAVLAAEDARFYRHFGVDPVGVARALWVNLRAGRVVEGASTITQQLARNLYLSPERTVARKLQEVLLALRLEAHLDKRAILERYLNTIYLGHGAYGIEVAARTYFGKPVRELTLAEGALLAGLIRGPEYLSPYRDPAAARARQRHVLLRMEQLGFITPEERARALAEPLRLAGLPEGPVGAYFIDAVRELLRQQAPAVAEGLDRGGYRIYTTMDLDAQRAAEEALRAGLGAPARHDARGVPQPQGALVALDPQTGEVRALVGGRDYRQSPFNRATRARRQPGSAFKPILYTALVDLGIPITATQPCAPVAYPSGGPEPYEPKDFGDEPYHLAYLTVRDAVRVSDNVVAVRWAAELGPRTVVDYARRLGVESPLEATLPIALGASPVTPLELARAYAALANLGFRVEPVLVRRVEDRHGRVVFQQQPRRTAVLDPATAYVVTRLLQAPFEPGGTAAHLRTLFPRPAAGKTGTTDGLRNAWFVGYTPQLVAAVYVGHDDGASLPAGGGALAGPIWARFMAAALRDAPVADWSPPAGVQVARTCVLGGPLDAPQVVEVTDVFLARAYPGDTCAALRAAHPEAAAPDAPATPEAPPGEAPEDAAGAEGAERPAPRHGTPGEPADGSAPPVTNPPPAPPAGPPPPQPPDGSRGGGEGGQSPAGPESAGTPPAPPEGDGPP